jgi:type I site-specific restriction endonuclease
MARSSTLLTVWDPKPRSRKVFSFARPETLSELHSQARQLRARLQNLPELDQAALWKVQTQAIRSLEISFGRADKRALVEMATGSGKTFTTVNMAYRLLKFGEANESSSQWKSRQPGQTDRGRVCKLHAKKRFPVFVLIVCEDG